MHRLQRSLRQFLDKYHLLVYSEFIGIISRTCLDSLVLLSYIPTIEVAGDGQKANLAGHKFFLDTALQYYLKMNIIFETWRSRAIGRIDLG